MLAITMEAVDILQLVQELHPCQRVVLAADSRLNLSDSRDHSVDLSVDLGFMSTGWWRDEALCFKMVPPRVHHDDLLFGYGDITRLLWLGAGTLLLALD